MCATSSDGIHRIELSSLPSLRRLMPPEMATPRNEYNRKNLEIAMASDPKTLAIDEIEVFEMHG